MTTATTSNKKSVEEICIDLPGEIIQCTGTVSNIKVILRKHRDVIFDINQGDNRTYTVEATDSDFYNARDQKLIFKERQGKVTFKDGELLPLWISRGFKGALLLKSDDKIIMRIEPNKLDASNYGADPKTKPEPMLIAIGKSKSPTLQCTADDPLGIANNHEAQRALQDSWLRDINNHGTQFDYLKYTQPRQVPKETEYVVVTNAEAHEILPHVRALLDKGQSVQDLPEKIFAPLTVESVLTRASSNFYNTLKTQAVTETAGYIHQNWRQFSKLGMRVFIEKAPLGKYRIVFKGKLLTRVAGQAATTAAGWALKNKVLSNPMGAPGSAFIDGSHGKTGKAGMGGAKRITITAASNFKTGMKIGMIDTVIDLWDDTAKVFCNGDDALLCKRADENNVASNDISEFLARAGVTIAKAGTTALLGGLIAAGLTAVIVGSAVVASAPVWVVVVAVIAGYVLAATIVDLADKAFEFKEHAASRAR